MSEISFVIAWCDRPELEVCLRRNRELFIDTQARVLIVNGGGDLLFLRGLIAAVGVPGIRIVDIEGARFNKCCCLNLGVSCSETERVFLLDADIILNRELVDMASLALSTASFVTVQKGIESRPDAHPQTLHSTPGLSERRQTTELLFRGGQKASVEFWQGSQGRSMPGVMMLRRSDYIAVEGCNSILSGWGFEDYDLQIRLQVQLGTGGASVGVATHITHDFNDAASRTKNEARNIQLCVQNYNRGDFLGTYSEDVARWKPKLRYL